MAIFFILWLLCGVITGSIAYSKNRFWLGWFILGCIIGIFGVIWIACLPALEVLEPDKAKERSIERPKSKKKPRKEVKYKEETRTLVEIWWDMSKWKRILGYFFAGFLVLMFVSVIIGAIQGDPMVVDSLFYLPLLVCIFTFIMGLVNPKLVLPWSALRTRGKVLLVYGLSSIVLFILASISTLSLHS